MLALIIMFVRNVKHKWIYLLFVLGNLATLGKFWPLFGVAALIWVCTAPKKQPEPWKQLDARSAAEWADDPLSPSARKTVAQAASDLRLK